ncbi:MAG: hypothetical protein ACYS8K_05180 [Planctomycetota bacterium]|jgi:hypothetical protein
MKAVVIVALCLLVPTGSGQLLAREKPAEQQATSVAYGDSVSVKPGALAGTVLYSDGKTPAAEVPIRLWGVEKGEFCQQTQTDETGHYELADLEPGRYYAVFADRVRVDLRVDEEAELSGGPLNVIVPRGKAVFAQMTTEQRSAVLIVLSETEGEPEEGDVTKMPLRTVLIVAGGSATAVGAAIIVENSDDDDHHVVSP